MAGTDNTSFNPIAAGLGTVGSIAGIAYDAYQQNKQRQWNEEMFNRQNAWNLEMWNKQNEYNTPANQVQRLRDAGLNPLYYGLDGSSAGAVSAATPLGYDRASMNGMSNPISAGLDAALRSAQIENVQANTAKQSEETLTEVKRREKIQQECQNAIQELENMKAQKGLTDSQKVELDKRISWIDRVNQAAVAKSESETKLNDSQRKRIEELLEGEKLLQSKSLEDFEHRWKKIQAEISKMSKESDVLQLDIENYALNHASNGFMGSGLSIQNFIRMLKGKNFIPDNVDYSDSDSISNEFGNDD